MASMPWHPVRTSRALLVAGLSRARCTSDTADRLGKASPLALGHLLQPRCAIAPWRNAYRVRSKFDALGDCFAIKFHAIGLRNDIFLLRLASKEQISGHGTGPGIECRVVICSDSVQRPHCMSLPRSMVLRATAGAQNLLRRASIGQTKRCAKGEAANCPSDR